MKKVSLITDIITTFISFILSLILIILILVFCLYLGIKQLGNPKQIITVFEGVNIEALTKSNTALNSILKKYNITDSQFDKLLESNAGKQILDLYSKDISSIFSKKTSIIRLNENKIAEIISQNYNELADILVKNKLQRKMADYYKNDVIEIVKNNSSVILDNIPTSAVIYKEVEKNGYSDFLNAVTNPDLMIYYIAFLVVIFSVIFAIRFFDFSGLIWIGVSTALSSVFMFIIALVLNGDIFKILISKYIWENAFTDSSISFFVKFLYKECIVLLLITLITIIAYTILKIFVINKNEIKNNTPEQ